MEVRPPSPGCFLFTSEAVCEGHPDNVADWVSDAIVDACLQQDVDSRVACETVTKTGLVMVFGDITTKAKVDYDVLVRDAVKAIGYAAPEHGLDYRAMEVVVKLDVRPPAAGAATSQPEAAEVQCVASGYATDETPELMPLSHSLARRLCEELARLRRSGECPWLRPDGKAQVTLEFRRNADGSLAAVRAHTVLLSVQHGPEVPAAAIQEEFLARVVRPVLPAHLLDAATVLHVNPSGRFVIGGPQGDAGATGRQPSADLYGGWGADSAGPLCGRDAAHHLDRAATYGCRWVAKSLVRNGLVARCLVQVAYAPGEAQPVSLCVDSYGSARSGASDSALCDIVRRNFDLRPSALTRDLKLKSTKYSRFAAHGHVGSLQEPIPEWENVKDLSAEVAKLGG